jgi:hypothetical protein
LRRSAKILGPGVDLTAPRSTSEWFRTPPRTSLRRSDDAVHDDGKGQPGYGSGRHA